MTRDDRVRPCDRPGCGHSAGDHKAVRIPPVDPTNPHERTRWQNEQLACRRCRCHEWL